MMNVGPTKYACGVEYLGTDYKGWQSQDNQETIQDRIESALSKVADEKIRIYSAGRTDSGVHALVKFFIFLQRPIEAKANGWMESIHICHPIYIFNGFRL
tara:strand:- start:1245 stop:1544 length:300 start_codon:yes stop_codon:yes gene_type:complete